MAYDFNARDELSDADLLELSKEAENEATPSTIKVMMRQRRQRSSGHYH